MTLDELLRRFRQIPGLEARFTENEHMALLALPLVSTGRILFRPPATLVRLTTAPTESRLIVRPDALVFDDAHQRGEVELGRHPVARDLVTGLLHLLAGDTAALHAIWRVDFTTDPHQPRRWTLRLTPRQSPLSELIDHLQFSGAELLIEDMTLIERSGDRRETHFEHVDLNRRFTSADDMLFQTPAATPRP